MLTLGCLEGERVRVQVGEGRTDRMGARGSRSAAAGPRPAAVAVLLAMDEKRKSCCS